MDTTDLVTTTEGATAPSNILVALSPHDLPAQQTQLLTWVRAKIAELARDRSDLTDNIRVAKNNAWAFQSLDRAAKKLDGRITYYQKILAAVEAGYLIVPNFEVEVMAVRVHRAHRSTSHAYRTVKMEKALPSLAPAGEGIYVDDANEIQDQSYETPDPQHPGQMKMYGLFRSVGYGETIDFPVALVKPIVLEATALAMSRKIFDRIGVVTGKKEDPVVVGQIIDPRSYAVWAHRPNKMITFFIAWWLDVRTL